MDLKNNSFFRGIAASAAGVVAFALPTLAFAEESSGGMALLMPRPAEFIPACIAFIIIWIGILFTIADKALLGLHEKKKQA